MSEGKATSVVKHGGAARPCRRCLVKKIEIQILETAGRRSGADKDRI